ncbi:MAG: HAD family phosphatase [Prosthecobacter sp.]|nr:HAD family phosphatase [Prosthecobacter sp.]
MNEVPSMLEIPDYPFRAFIFDCDGTLVDSMPLHYQAWLASLQQHAAPFDFTEELFYAKAGVREQDVVIELNALHGTQVDPDSVAHVKAQMFLEIIPQVNEIKPVADYARSLVGRFPLAVASGSEEPIVRGCLAANGLLDLFPVIVTPAYVKRGKPAPDMFLLAAEKMGVDPKDCLVLEDGQAGIVAAEAAGMQWAFVPRTLR